MSARAKTVVEELSQKQLELHELGLRLGRGWAFWKELRRCAGAERFQVVGDLAWDAALSFDRMLLIDIGNWAVGLEFWIRDHIHTAALRDLRAGKKRARELAARPGRNPGDSPDWLQDALVAATLRSHTNALRVLFGPAVVERRAADGRDVERLRTNIRRSAETLKSHRNAQAHRYGLVPAPTAALRRRAIARRLKRYAQILAALRLLLDNSHYAMPRFKASAGNWGDGLVDAILLGSATGAAEQWKDEPGEYFWQKREAHYRRRRREQRKRG